MIHVGIPGVDPGVGTLLSFSAVAMEDGFVLVVASVRFDNGDVASYRIKLPVERAQGYSEKLHVAVSRALMFAPRRAG